jgi:small subunit ribosomal protein S3
MGQKVNPVGFRTGIMIGWKSRWYASKQEFAELLVEDQKIRDYIKNRKDKGGKAFTLIARSKSNGLATK